MQLLTLKLKLADDAYVVDPHAVAAALLRSTDPRTAILPLALSRPGARGPSADADRRDR